MSAQVLGFINYAEARHGTGSWFGSRKLVTNRSTDYRLDNGERGEIVLSVRLHATVVAWVRVDASRKRITNLRLTFGGWPTQVTTRVVSQVLSLAVGGVGWPRMAPYAARLPTGMVVPAGSSCALEDARRVTPEAYAYGHDGFTSRVQGVGIRACGTSFSALADPRDVFEVDTHTGDVTHLDPDGHPLQPGRFEVYKRHRMPVAVSRLLADALQFVKLAVGTSDHGAMRQYLAACTASVREDRPVEELRALAAAVKRGEMTVADVAESLHWTVVSGPTHGYRPEHPQFVFAQVIAEHTHIGAATTYEDFIKLSRGESLWQPSP